MINVTELVDETTTIYRNSNGPFPYNDCFKLQAEYRETFDDFIPHLDLFDSVLIGYASRAGRLLNLPVSETEKLQKLIETSFFETFPKYKVAQEFITPENVPDLYALLRKLEQVRSNLMLLMESKNQGEV